MLELFSYSFIAMGTDCNIHIYAGAEEQAERSINTAASEVARIERRYSRYLPDSLLAKINETARRGGDIGVDKETAYLLDHAFALHEMSGGLFDITTGILRRAWNFDSGRLPERGEIEALLPKIGLDKIRWDNPRLTFTVAGMELDFGGIGKEYAADSASAVLKNEGIEHGLVELGGDIHVTGPHPGGAPWIVGIQHPRKPGELIGEVAVKDGALASSGDYERIIEIGGERYSHILNPLTGWPARGLSAVSVMSQSCLMAGSYCTIAILKEKSGPDWLEITGVKHLWIKENGQHGGSIILSPHSE